jgi:hypothetical protein
MLLTGKSILVVDHRVGRFATALSAGLEGLGADVLVALDVDKALRHLERFDFDACLIGSVADTPENCQKLIVELGGVPLVHYGAGRSSFCQIDKSIPASSEDVSDIVKSLEGLLNGQCG